MRIICISPEFSEYQEGAENKQINLIKITKYEEKIDISLESKCPVLFSNERVNIRLLCQEFNVDELVQEKLLEIDNLFSPHIYKKERLKVDRNYFFYKREGKS